MDRSRTYEKRLAGVRSYMKEHNLVFDHKTFNYLFLSNKEFDKRFGITNEEIKEKYPYKK